MTDDHKSRDPLRTNQNAPSPSKAATPLDCPLLNANNQTVRATPHSTRVERRRLRNTFVALLEKHVDIAGCGLLRRLRVARLQEVAG